MKLFHFFKYVLFFMLFLVLSPLFPEVGYVLPWGKDKEIVLPSCSINRPVRREVEFMTYMAFQAILFRQKVLAPVDGPRSHFRPTSSQYMFDAMQKYGFIKGFVMGCDRLLRENKEEWIYPTIISTGGHLYKWDPIPSSRK